MSKDPINRFAMTVKVSDIYYETFLNLFHVTKSPDFDGISELVPFDIFADYYIISNDNVFQDFLSNFPDFSVFVPCGIFDSFIRVHDSIFVDYSGVVIHLGSCGFNIFGRYFFYRKGSCTRLAIIPDGNVSLYFSHFPNVYHFCGSIYYFDENENFVNRFLKIFKLSYIDEKGYILE